MTKTTKSNTQIVCGSRLHDTDYIFTNLGGAYRVYPLASPYAEDLVGMFTTWNDMWAWVSDNA